MTGAASAAQPLDRATLTAVPLTVSNSGDVPIRCEAEIAHWFAQSLAAIAPGGSADLGLEFSQADGTWAAINARGEAMPVERVWCGIDGRSYATRRMLVLDRADPRPTHLDCRAGENAVECR